MNWSVYSEFVGGVFGAPLAIEGLAAFALEATFIGLWVFGWDRLSPRVHLATIWLVALGTWLSAYFILVANSWMQHPVGLRAGRRRGARSPTCGRCSPTASRSTRSPTRCSWPADGGLARRARRRLLAPRARAQRRPLPRAAALALIVAVPVTAAQPRRRQPLRAGDDRLPADEDRGGRGAVEHRAAGELLAVPDRRLLAVRPGPRASRLDGPALLSFLATGTFTGEVEGLNQIQAAYEQQYGPGNYIPPVARVVLGDAGDGLPRRADGPRRRSSAAGCTGARKLRDDALVPAHRRSSPSPSRSSPRMAGWVLTEIGRQPWIVQGLLRTADAHSPSVSTTDDRE